jgi:chaperone BCS1
MFSGGGPGSASAAAGGGHGIMSALEGNPYFNAGFGLTMIGVGLAMLRRASAQAMVIARKQLTMTLEVTSKDQSYPWVLSWLHAQSRLSVSTMRQHIR